MMPPFSVSTVSVLLVWLITTCESQSTCSVENSLRLVGGTTQLEGRVEICQGGLWGTVCDDLWDNVDAQVTCGQLGYSRNGAEAVSQAQFGRGSGPILLDSVQCSTTDTRLADCTHVTVHNCSHSEDAGVRCQPRSCEDGEIRLANGLHEYEGRVEVCLNREWGTVCDDNWNNKNAAVVCTQLGYSRYNASTARFGQGTGSILLDDVACSGQESRLINCTYDPVTADCTHSEDAGVRCSTDVTCQDGNVRLIGGDGGDGGNEGRVEVCLNEQWGTVCNDLWSVEDAQVVCSQLGFSKQGVTVIEFATPGTGLISLDNVECAGTEARLIDCSYDSHTADCTHAEDAGVRCVIVPPGVPRNVTTSSITTSSVTVSWSQPLTTHINQDVVHYIVNCSTAAGHPDVTHTTIDNSTLSRTLPGLQPYTTYTCCVKAVGESSVGENVCNSFQTLEAAPSSTPVNVTVDVLSQTTATVSWDPPNLSDHNGLIRQYRIVLMEVGGTGAVKNFTTVGQTGSFVFDFLRPGQVYLVKIAAETIDIGPSSEYVEFSSLDDVPPGVPRNVTTSSITTSSVTVSWSQPLTTRINQDVVRYIVNCSTAAGQPDVTHTTIDNSTLSRTLPGLRPYMTYTCCVKAVGESSIGEDVCNSFQTLEAAPSSAPVNVTVDVLSQTTATVSWDPPNLSDHNGLIRQYRIVLMEVGGTGAVKNFTTVGQTGSYVFDFLRPGQVYLVKIAAETVDIGPSSEYVEFSSRDDVPGLPTNFEVAIADSTSTHLTWSPPSRDQQNGVILGYVINVTLITPRRTDSQQLTFETTSLNYTITSLHPSWTYLFSVAANTSAGLGASVFHVGTLHEDAPSEPPQNLAGTNHTSKTMYLFWDPPPVDEQNGVVRNYKITILNQETGVSIMYSTTGTRYIFEDLHPYYRYTYSVAAHTVKTGPYATVVIRQPEDIPTGSPTDASVNHTSPTNAIVQWSSVSAHLQNGLISGYTVRATPLQSDIEYENIVGPNVFMYEFHRVSSNTPYTFSVAAMTSVGRGPFITVSSTTPEGVPSVAPNIGSVTRISATQIQLQWAPLSVEDIQGTLTSYLVRYRVVESRVRRNIDDSAVVVEVSGTDKIIDGLEPHLTYGVSVAARTARGIGNYSEEMIVGLFENSPFQLHMFGAIICLPWTEAGTAEKMNSIAEELSSNVQDTSCMCDFSSKYIAQRKVLCGNLSTDRVIFHGTFISTANNTSTQFRDQLQQWVYSEPAIIVQGVHLTVVPCSVSVEESCVPAPEISTPTSVTTISATTIAEVVGISLPLIGGVAGGGVLLILFCMFIVIIICLNRKHKVKEVVQNEMHPLQHFTEYLTKGNHSDNETNIDDTISTTETADQRSSNAHAHTFSEPSCSSPQLSNGATNRTDVSPNDTIPCPIYESNVSPMYDIIESNLDNITTMAVDQDSSIMPHPMPAPVFLTSATQKSENQIKIDEANFSKVNVPNKLAQKNLPTNSQVNDNPTPDEYVHMSPGVPANPHSAYDVPTTVAHTRLETTNDAKTNDVLRSSGVWRPQPQDCRIKTHHAQMPDEYDYVDMSHRVFLKK